MSLALSNQANLLDINLEIVLAMLGELLLVLRRISELRPNFLKHSQNSHFNYNDPTLIHSTTVRSYFMPAPLTMPRFHVGCRLGLLDKSNFVCAQASNASESACIIISIPWGFFNRTKFTLLSNRISWVL